MRKGARGNLTPRSRKAVVKELDSVVSQWARKKYGACVLCQSHFKLQCGHLFGRVAYSTRWASKNVYSLCAECNIRMEQDSEKAHKLYVYACMVHGSDAIFDLHRQYETPHRYTTAELVELLDTWKELLAEQAREQSIPDIW